MQKISTQKLVLSAACLALAYVLPFLTGNIPYVGSMLLPMHLPVLLCGFLCGGPYGLLVGFLSPLLRAALVGMPSLFPTAIAMAFELATYGFVCGILSKKAIHSLKGVYLSLIVAMIAGRIVWGLVRLSLTFLNDSTFPISAFFAGAFTKAIPGIILQLILVPAVVLALRRSRILAADPT